MEDPSSDGPAACECGCRQWVEQELARLRAELATEVRTRHIFVGSTGAPSVSIVTADDHASVQVVAADGRVCAEVVASADDTEAFAGFSLVVRGDVVAVFSVVDPHTGKARSGARLVFDQPSTDQPWTVVDAEGLRKED